MTSAVGAHGDRRGHPAYVRPTWRQAMVDSLPRRWRGPGAERWVERLPMAVVIAVFAVLSLPLHNTAFVDEARAVNAGRATLAHWFGATAPPPVSGYFSGVSGIYPVVVATLDRIGGLAMARVFSWFCVVVAVCALYAVAARLFGSGRVGVFAAALFVVTAPVVVVANLATPDAPAIAAVAVAAWCAASGRSVAAAVAVGLLLDLAIVLSPTSAVLAPQVLLLLVTARPGGRTGVRAAVAVAVAVLGCAAAYLPEGSGLRANVALVGASLATVEGGASPLALGVDAAIDLGLVIVLALCGVAYAIRSTTGPAGRAARGPVVVGACCFLASVSLPVVHVVAAAPNAVDQAGAYTALGLAPSAGRGLMVLSRRLFRMIPVAVIFVLALLPGSARSMEKFHEWADVSDVLADLRAHPQPGRYLTETPDVFAFYLPGTVWESTEGLDRLRRDGAQDAVHKRRYAVVLLGSTGGPDPDRDRLLAALRLSPDYEQDAMPRPADPTAERWLVYRLVTVAV